MIATQLDGEQGTRCVEVRAAYSGEHVVHRKLQRLDRILRRAIEGHQRAALLDEVRERPGSLVAEPATQGIGIIGAEAADDRVRLLVGYNDDVEQVAELAGADVTVDDRGVRAVVAVEGVARPTLVHRRGIAAIVTDAPLAPG